jgi:hypothetical protein
MEVWPGGEGSGQRRDIGLPAHVVVTEECGDDA